MRKIITCLFLFILFSCASARAENLLRNGGFESGNKSPWNSRGGARMYYVSSNASRSGKYSGKIILNPSGGEQQYMCQKVSGKFGQKKFKFSGWIKSQDMTGDCMLTIKFFHTRQGRNGNAADEYNLKTIKGTEDWTSGEGEYVAPPKCEQIVVYMICQRGSGTAYMDDFSLEQTGGPPGSPAAPGELSAAADADRITLKWHDNSSNEEGFEIERCRDGIPEWVPVATVPANTTTYDDNGLPASTKFLYRVRAKNASGSSSWSNTADVDTNAARINMLENPSFEEGETGWRAMGAGTSIVEGSAHEGAGTKCLKIEMDPSIYKQQRYQNVKGIKGGDTYDFSCWIKTENMEKGYATLILKFWTGPRKARTFKAYWTPFVKVNQGWQKVEKKGVVAPADFNGWCQIVCFKKVNSGPGTIYFDDMSLVRTKHGQTPEPPAEKTN